jgi:hypothetical protein
MQRKSFEEYKDLFLQARASNNWNDVVLWSTELIHYKDDLAYVWANRGVGLSRLGHPLDAVLNYERALKLENENEQRAILYSNIGAAYWDMMNASKAIDHLNQALWINPLAQTYLTLGNIYKYQSDLPKAIEAYRNSIFADSTYVDGHMVLGMALLKAGELEEGWKEYEWRWKSDQLPPRKLKCPQWNGQDLTNKTILVYGEQGLGDIIQFARYARILGNRYPRAKVIIEGRQTLNRLLNTIPEVYAVIDAGEKLPALDYAVPMLTLAGMFTPNPGAIPADDREYFLNSRDIERWADKFKVLPEGIRIGICWAGMARTAHPTAMAIDQLRSAELASFAPLAKVPGIMWVSLQKGPPASQIVDRPNGMNIADFTEEMHDFYETCCAIEACDLVITVDTAVVHAAASLGKPTWLLSRWDGCWRWFGDRADSPWYPSLRQFVQHKPHDWNGVMKEVARELAEYVKNKSEPEFNLTLAK